MSDAKTLNDLIDARGLSIGEVAKRAKIAPFSLKKLRNGLVANARPTTVSRLAKVLGVDPARVRAAIEASRAAAE